MTINEFTTVKFMSYDEYCNYLKAKYGEVEYDYFHKDNKDGHLIQDNKGSRGSIGLQRHHICEKYVANLSDPRIAAENSFEYQKKENLCYCNLLEHMFLHILIAEDLTSSSEYLGDGGVLTITLPINSILAGIKEDSKAFKNKNDEIYYDFNGIITNNKNTYLALINRYCTSAEIRSKRNMSPIDLVTEIIQQVCTEVKDIGSLRTEIINSAKKTKLFQQNITCFAELQNYLKTNRTALVQICTGGGKTTTALEYLRIYGGKALVLGPKDVIEGAWKPDGKDDEDIRKHTKYYNYQSFLDDDKIKKFDYSKYSIVICDEAHHLSAKQWPKVIHHILENTNLKIIGLTATPSLEQERGKDPIFEGRICRGLSLAQGILEDRFYPFSYIQSIYRIEDIKSEFETYGLIGNELWDKLDIERNVPSTSNIMKANMPKGIRKIIAFAPHISEEDNVVRAIKEYNPDIIIDCIDNTRTSEHNSEAIERFKKTNDRDICLVNIGMVCEGAHYDGINTLVMFRRTDSSTLYLQQLGRIITIKNEHPDDPTQKPTVNPHGIVFDFTNNATHLTNLNNLGIDFESASEIDRIMRSNKKKADEEAREKGFTEIIIRNYASDCTEILNNLKNFKKSNTVDNKIFDCFKSTLLDLDKWSKLKEPKNSSTPAIKATPSNTEKSIENSAFVPLGGMESTNESNSGGEAEEKKSGKGSKGGGSASNRARLIAAFKVAIKRLYNFKAIDFENTIKSELKILDEEKFNKIINDVGFPEGKLFREAADQMGYFTCMIAKNVN